MLYRLIVLETDLAEKVKTEKSEYNDPDSKINLSVKDTPMVSLVSDTEELETECDFNKSEDNLY